MGGGGLQGGLSFYFINFIDLACLENSTWKSGNTFSFDVRALMHVF